MRKEQIEYIRKEAGYVRCFDDVLRTLVLKLCDEALTTPECKANWKSIKKQGNPLKEGKYLVTYLDRFGNYKVGTRKFKFGKWLVNRSIIVAWDYLPNSYPYEEYKRELE